MAHTTWPISKNNSGSYQLNKSASLYTNEHIPSSHSAALAVAVPPTGIRFTRIFAHPRNLQNIISQHFEYFCTLKKNNKGLIYMTLDINCSCSQGTNLFFLINGSFYIYNGFLHAH